MTRHWKPARRICWPNPDATCLEGGCGWCDEYPFRTLAVIERYARSAGQVPNRCGGETQNAWAAYRYPAGRDWDGNFETRGM